MYKIPEEVKSGIYLGFGIYFFDLAVIMGFWFITAMFDELIYPAIRPLYTGYNVLLAVFLTRPSHTNPGKKIYQVLLIKKQNRDQYQYHGRSIPHEKIGYERR